MLFLGCVFVQLPFFIDTVGGLDGHLDVIKCTFVGRIIGTDIVSAALSSIVNSVGTVGASLMLWILVQDV